MYKLLLDVQNVTKAFPASYPFRKILAVQHISLSVVENEFVCIVGPVGCGKTTFLNMIAGFEKPTEGKILFKGKEVTGPGPDRGVTFQEVTLFPWMTVIQNIEFGLRMQGSPKKEAREIAMRYLALVGLEGFGHLRPHELSGGMKRKVELARILGLDPGVLLMDEPLCAIDAITRQRLREEILAIWEREPKTVIYVTHNIDEALFFADRVVVFTARPARIKSQFWVRIPRPRNLFNKKILELKKKMLSELSQSPDPTK